MIYVKLSEIVLFIGVLVGSVVLGGLRGFWKRNIIKFIYWRLMYKE